MPKLTTSQVAGRLDVSPYTVKRWYSWYEQEDFKVLAELTKNGMPALPKFETIGTNNWRYWNEEDLEQLRKFKEWVPHTRAGIFQKCKKENK